MIESFEAVSSRLDALIFKETFEEKLQKLFEKDSSLEEYVNLVKEMYDMPGFRDLKPIPAYDMSGLQEMRSNGITFVSMVLMEIFHRWLVVLK